MENVLYVSKDMFFKAPIKVVLSVFQAVQVLVIQLILLDVPIVLQDFL